MKESMAGTWIFGIVALFIVLFSSFIAYSISYTKAFKVKNEILNYIEQAEGFTTAAIKCQSDLSRIINTDAIDSCDAVDAKTYALIKNMGYNTAEVSCEGYGEYQLGGYCVQRVCDSELKKDHGRVVYKVTTFIKINLPVINVGLKLPISGETNALYYSNGASIGCPVKTTNMVEDGS